MASLDAAALPTDMDVHRTRAFLRRAAANGAAMMLSDESDEVRARRRDAIIAAARSNGVAVSASLSMKSTGLAGSSGPGNFAKAGAVTQVSQGRSP